ncbi:hypothetical protein [Clostridium pasteurianum]|uniref:Uncharacterized protein n=1 Tax=Clostridium pasteurianum BC1 TaxID=86416 RepID=R4K3I3_CLOPA|nr:hypothetical protein [Clostridium pasteurianum]AGK97138.1 hypothetical protein Clopa_2268 [Clostridium pasteurianum BC1]
MKEEILSDFPQIKSDIKQKIVGKYSSSGILELSEEDERIITEIETEGKKFDNKVICVIDGIMSVGDTQIAVTSYTFTDNEFKPYKYNGCLVIYAKCYNHTWN